MSILLAQLRSWPIVPHFAHRTTGARPGMRQTIAVIGDSADIDAGVLPERRRLHGVPDSATQAIVLHGVESRAAITDRSHDVLPRLRKVAELARPEFGIL